MDGGVTGNTLLLSMRRIENIVAYSGCYEFEDTIAAVTNADRIDADNFAAINRSRRSYRLARSLTGSPNVARKLATKIPWVTLERDYELFFPVFNHPHELYTLNAISNWRKRSRIAACFICEVFPHLVPKYLLELLCEFDHIFIGSSTAVDELSKITGRPCSYLPFASDVLKFSPIPSHPQRSIDVCNIGRRSEVTHNALVKLARERNIFYYYDTVASSGIDQKQRTFRVQNASEHRLLLANLLQRSRYFIANLSRANEPGLNRGRQEISGRFYEGAAAGAVMIGAPPECDDFHEQFGWVDSIIRMPFDAPDIGRVIADLDTDQARLARISSHNIHHAALRHDWSHRFQAALNILGLPATTAMLERERKLQSVAALALTLNPIATHRS
jgi:hypothetical protein